MTRATVRAARSRLLAPLVHLAALLLLLEEWCWAVGMRLGARVADWPALQALEARVRLLPPYWALCIFVTPGLLLFPVKVVALVAIAHGHVVPGIAAIVVAKLGGAAVVARLYVLTLPTLLALGWFARCHGWFIDLKNRCIARLRASRAYRASGLALGRLRRALSGRPGAQSGRIARVLRRFIAQWRARRR